MKIIPKNWKAFQHYKHRRPPWIRLYRDLLDNYDFQRLPVASRALAPCLWLLASEHQDGCINASVSELAFRLRQSEKEIAEAIGPLIESGFFIQNNDVAECKQDASAMLAPCARDATPEKSRVETETEKRSGTFVPDSPFRPLPYDDDLGPTKSAEDEFWEIVETQSKTGALSRAMMIKHAKLSRDFHDSVSCIKAALRAKDPRSYLGKAISNISEQQRAPPEPGGF